MNTTISKNRHALGNENLHLMLLMACAIALVPALVVSQPARADRSTPPTVPTIIQVPAGNQLFRVAHAIGTQNYVCLSTGWASRAYGPQATLFNEENEQVLTHFLSPNPDEANAARATWQDSRDTSTVWANAIDGASYTPDPTAIPWLLLKVVGRAQGPTGGDRMTGTTYIQRLNTTGGLKPAGTCMEGDRSLVPYTADYYFYKATDE
jgi:uncharacterized protein DUF3455